MNDYSFNVRQIAQYPAATAIGPNDVVLLQQGGVGGAYASATSSQFLSGVPGASVGVTPANPPSGLVTSFVTSLLGARQGYNWYVDQNGIQRYLQNGVAGIWSFGPDGKLTFSIAPQFYANAQLLYATPLLQLGADGSLSLPLGQVSVGRDPIAPEELTTLQWVQANTVQCFNGRSGAVWLSPDDINMAYGVDPCDALATQSWVNTQICNAVADWYNVAPFVFTFNGRCGDIALTLDDIETVFFAGTYPTVPSPPLGDASNKIATTMFVDESLEDWAGEINNSWNAADYEILNIVQTQYAPLNSPNLTGYPTAPTANPGSSTGQIATTAYVMNAVAESVTGVASFNTRTGNVVLDQQDIISANGWANVALTGVPTAPTAPNGTQTGQIATTAFVLQEISAINAGVLSWNGRSGVVSLQAADLTGVGGALLASPTFTGVPAAPTAAPGTSTTQLATTQFVMNNSVASFNSRTGAITLTSNDVSGAGGALVASPTFTGVPAAPTATAGTSTTQLATCAFVMAAIAGVGGVNSFNGRQGAITLTAADVTGANPQYFPLVGGTITGGTAGAGGVAVSNYYGFTPTAPDLATTRSVEFYGAAQSGPGTCSFYAADGNEPFVCRHAASVGFRVYQSANVGFEADNCANFGFYSGGPAVGYAANTGSSGTGFLAQTNATGFSSTGHSGAGFNSSGGSYGFVAAGTATGISISGTAYKPGGGSWTDSSDARIKVVRGDYEVGLEAVLKLSPKRVHYLGNDTIAPPPEGEEPPYSNSMHELEAKARKEFITFVAQEVEPIFPEMVNRHLGFINRQQVNDLRTVDTTPLIYALVNSIKELAARVAALEGT